MIQKKSYIGHLREDFSDVLINYPIREDMYNEIFFLKKLDNFEETRVQSWLSTNQLKPLYIPLFEYFNQDFDVFKGDFLIFRGLDFLFCKTVRTFQVTKTCKHYIRHCTSILYALLVES